MPAGVRVGERKVRRGWSVRCARYVGVGDGRKAAAGNLLQSLTGASASNFYLATRNPQHSWLSLYHSSWLLVLSIFFFSVSSVSFIFSTSVSGLEHIVLDYLSTALNISAKTFLFQIISHLQVAVQNILKEKTFNLL